MHTTNFGLPTSGAKKVTLPHVTMLNGPRSQAADTRPTPKKPLTSDTPAALILVGLDDQGKPHASWFENEQADAAAVAADLMGFAIIDVQGDELMAVASSLPKGKLFESGKAFVPFVKRTVYDQLAAHLDDEYLTNAAARVEAAQAAANSYAHAKREEIPPRLPDDWSKLLVGDLVLSLDDPDEGWFEAIIVEVMGGEKFRLRWRDYPDLPEFSRGVLELALLHPHSVAR